MAALFITSTTTLPILRSFCLFAGMGVLFLYIFAITFFVGCLTIDEKRNPFPITSVKFCTRIPFIDDSKCRDLMLQYAQYARQQAGFKLVDSANK